MAGNLIDLFSNVTYRRQGPCCECQPSPPVGCISRKQCLHWTFSPCATQQNGGKFYSLAFQRITYRKQEPCGECQLGTSGWMHFSATVSTELFHPSWIVVGYYTIQFCDCLMCGPIGRREIFLTSSLLVEIEGHFSLEFVNYVCETEDLSSVHHSKMAENFVHLFSC
jgi:hypothetical protein